MSDDPVWTGIHDDALTIVGNPPAEDLRRYRCIECKMPAGEGHLDTCSSIGTTLHLDPGGTPLVDALAEARRYTHMQRPILVHVDVHLGTHDTLSTDRSCRCGARFYAR